MEDPSKKEKRRGGVRTKAKKRTPTNPPFEGKCDALKGFIYDCSDNKQADQFVSTTLEIATYVGSNFKHGGDVRLALTNLQIPQIPHPEDPPPNATASMRKIWENQCAAWSKREETYISNMQQIYSLIWGQCTETMQAKLEGLVNYESINNASDALTLLREMKKIAFNA